jgi:hypothetical protein
MFMGWTVLMAFWLALVPPGYPAEEVVIGNINWVNGYITATGQATASPSGNKALDQLMATRAAMIYAQRALLETIKGVRIDSTTRVENMMLQQDTIVAQVSGIIQGAQVVKTTTEWVEGAPLVTVEMRLCLNQDQCTTGKSLLSALNLEQRGEPAHAPPQRFSFAPAPEPPQSPAPASTPAKVEARPKFYPYDTGRPVTGVILDLEGRFFERELMPVVVTIGEDKTPLTVYSAKNVSPKVIRMYGVVRYADSVEQAKKNPYLGDNVLVIPVENVTKENMLVIHRDGARKIGETMSHGNDYLGDAKVVIADK